MKVSDIMTKKVITVRPNDTLEHALRVFARNKISGCPVVDSGNRISGILTQADILKIIDVHYKVHKDGTFLPLVLSAIRSEKFDDLKKGFEKVLKEKVRKFMNRKVISVSIDEDIYKAARIMNRYRINRLPVLKGNKVVGIVARGDIIRALDGV